MSDRATELKETFPKPGRTGAPAAIPPGLSHSTLGKGSTPVTWHSRIALLPSLSSLEGWTLTGTDRGGVEGGRERGNKEGGVEYEKKERRKR